MHDDKMTGNPVFDYRSRFRTKANSFQRVLIFGGMVFIVAGIFALASSVVNEHVVFAAWAAAIMGIGLTGIGLGWGFFWRRKIRTEFRKKYDL